MSNFTVNYYDPNNINYVGTMSNIEKIINDNLTSNDNCMTDTINTLQNCQAVKNSIDQNTYLANEFKNKNSKNGIALGLYNDSSIFYTTQYIQLWNMLGGIALSGVLIYYLLKTQK